MNSVKLLSKDEARKIIPKKKFHKYYMLLKLKIKGYAIVNHKCRKNGKCQLGKYIRRYVKFSGKEWVVKTYHSDENINELIVHR